MISYFAEVEKVAALKPDILAHIDLIKKLNANGEFFDEESQMCIRDSSRTAQYKATIAKLKTAYKGKVDILCGIAWDILSEDKRTGYDYWIGSAPVSYTHLDVYKRPSTRWKSCAFTPTPPVTT